MHISHQLIQYLQESLSVTLNVEIEIRKVTQVNGGSINHVYQLHTSHYSFLLKLNSKYTYPKMFELEAAGLQAISDTGTIKTPEIVLCNSYENQSFLLLEWIETITPSSRSSALLGEQLAAMHKSSNAYFGFMHDNYMGSLPQSNTRRSTWADFFIVERLQPMVRLALNKNLLSPADADDFERLYKQVPQLFDEEAPSLLHGDLWSGNYIIDVEGKPYLIDPAVSYGHREFDMAMTTLFGGFEKDFYQTYNESYPLATGWQQRVDLWNLYTLLLHLNLFGKSYLNRVKSALQQYL
ncbi:fructosamine kinase family protein [Mucilaginibacter koreensis]